MTSIVRVALPVPRGDSYDYLCPQPVSPGMRVRVPFGPRRLVGVVIGLPQRSAVAKDKLRPLIEVLDSEPLLTAQDLALIEFAARYYQAPLGQAMATALPKLLRQGKPAQALQETRWQATEAGHKFDAGSLKRAPRQAAALSHLQAAEQPLAAAQIGPEGCPGAVLKALQDKDLVEVAASEELAAQTVAPPALNQDQAAAVAAVQAANGFHCHLLDGVTGSGKTEVYLALARAEAAQGRQTLLLVPEIGLTPQMIKRVRDHTGARTVALHSGLADGARHNAYLAARNGEAEIVLGTRSAIFVPLARPGLIVVDEEHDSSYKQQDGIRYHARDLAVRRAQQLGLPVILGSATPSLESLHNVAQQRYRRLSLTQRHGEAQPPRISHVDLRGQRDHDGLSNALIARMKQHLAQDQQVMLFINRRGFAPVLLCHECGWTALCERCDARLISHRSSGSLRCHHCDHRRPQPANCPDCGSAELRQLGQGTERIEARVAQLFPEVPRIRLDRDQVARRGELEAALQAIQSGQARIIIGTQMLAKGHDFPRLSLVGIIDADQGLYGSDFRASEQLAQQIVQVAGRAGRRDVPGEVVIQTHNPDHPLLAHINPGQYGPLASALLAERQQTGWPPYSHLVLIRAEANQAELANAVLERLAEPLYGHDELDVLGPVAALMERRGGKYRQQLLLRSHNRGILQAQLPLLRQQLESGADARKIRWTIDVDPHTLD